jgi:Ca2+-binding EF-hand superfamily protein
MWRILLLIAGLTLLSGPGARAEPGRAVEPLLRGGLPELPKALGQQLAERPEQFLEEVAELIIGHGHGGEIDAGGIERFIGLERARVRAYHLRRMLQADIDGDGDIAMDELRALQHVSSARQRGLLELDHRRADGDRDGRVSALELQAMAEGRAREALSEDEAAGYRAILGFDLDGSGAVTLDEVIRAVAAFRGELT